MRHPGTLRILGQRVRVNLRAHVEDDEDGAGRAGHMDIAEGAMTIGTHQSEDQIADTLVHETLHFMLQFIGHDDETMVWRLSPVLLQFLRENPRWYEAVTTRWVGGKGSAR